MKTKEEKELKGTLRPSRIKDDPMNGTIATIEDVDSNVFLNDYSKQEYERCFVELSEMGVIQTTDISSLIMLCDMWGVYCDMKDAIRGKRYMIDTPNGLEQTSMSLTNFFRSYAEYFKLCKEFGLTPIARTKINITPKDVGDDFETL
jgi:P27 family predicted phage terminase small subunit